MLDDFVEKVRGFILSPVGTFRASKEDSLGTAFIYFVILVIINAILSTLVLIAGINAMNLPDGIPVITNNFPAILFFGLIVAGIVGVFIGGAWLHLFVWLLGGKRGYIETVKTIMYGLTPGLLIDWIPLVGIIGLVWSMVLVVLGLQELQEISTGRAVAAVIIAAVTVLVIIILVAALFFITGPGVVTAVPANVY